LTALDHQEADRVPVWTMINSAAVYRHFAPQDFDFTSVLDPDNPFSPEFQQLYRAACHGLGIDVTFANANPFPLEAEPGRARWRERPLKSLDDLARFTPPVPTYDELVGPYVAGFRKIQTALAPHTLHVSQGTASVQYYNVTGLQLFCEAMHEAPGDVGRVLDAYSEAHRVQARIYADHRLAPAYQVSCDVGGKSGTLFSPDYLRREAFPRLKREIEPLKQAGIKVIVHSDGDIAEILDDLLAIGVDGINPLEVSAGMDLAAVRKRYGRNLVLVGNVDAAYALPFGGPAEVEADVKRCLRDAADGGGYFLDTSAGEIMASVPVENVLAMFDAVREHGQYPIRMA
ncbi:MAG TPA: uroporphyrinogen decarboxylase family protein, partial [Armatimonadota bacterium]|nr:uroporphyrinogen decarboxylase family protein [Armatimonadota bacterium]